eukprot:TRINITY_DN29134_c0_g1_i1.p1 TRINITY_DN29134_c0_g1~~TRINITY_DN29134_c0_g1_i1.p1  ORF type:complete len:583 (+),score=54.16 TRINITY_DN29134_c0_g1_i1:148-1896(+)
MQIEIDAHVLGVCVLVYASYRAATALGFLSKRLTSHVTAKQVFDVDSVRVTNAHFGSQEPEEEAPPRDALGRLSVIAHVAMAAVLVAFLRSCASNIQYDFGNFVASDHVTLVSQCERLGTRVLDLAGRVINTVDSAVTCDMSEETPKHLPSFSRKADSTMAPLKVGLTRQPVAFNKIAESQTLVYRSAYFGTLMLGTPGVSFTFVFDTGSGHLVVPSSYCRHETCKAHKRYSRKRSSSAVDIDGDGSAVSEFGDRDTLDVTYGTGDIEGIFIDDVVCIPPAGVFPEHVRTESTGDNSLEVGCTRMRFVAATQMSDEPFSYFDFDGIVGLGLSNLSQSAEFNFPNMIASMLPVGVGLPYVFGIFFADNARETSELSLGGWDSSRLSESLTWNDVATPERGYWLLPLKSVIIDGLALPSCGGGNCVGILDTGTSLLSVPPDDFREIYEALWHPSELDGLCRGEGPMIQFELEAFNISLGPEDYAHAERFQSPRWPRFGASIEDGQKTRSDIFCRPLIMSVDVSGIHPNMFILGEPVLRKYYTVFDALKKRVGFGRAVHTADEIPLDWSDHADDNWFETTKGDED